MADFYSSYSAYKNYQPVSLGGKDIERLDAEVWGPAAFATDMRCLELGSGTGLFLQYLAHKGVQHFHGLDHDENLKAVLSPDVLTRFSCQDVWQYLEADTSGKWDRIVLLDVLEHFSSDDGFRLLSQLRNKLAKNGKIVFRVPNGASPWGMSYQYGDLTHKTAFSPESLRQLATACDLQVDRVYDQRRGSRRRLITDAMVQKLLSWALLTPPPLWGANLYCILSLK